ncbi:MULTISPECIES: adenylate/guanylate cyclase domain-containing protein [unclassified Minwuia]|jgi:class 3 adenylate cyclase|uniref:adenylate/guanylate cyclase domain-containing protein n=1 Tax=unclassified Minwuia TaxID=2618799 RepID=UPI002479DF94|nr:MULTISPECIES: adenylate/guanylate cyclase domain-containing protein [unclassified Minwuia]
MSQVYTRTFTYTFAEPVEAVWPALADTARYNEAAGFPKHRIEERRQSDGTVRLFAAGRMGRVELAWEEFPVEWVLYRWFWHWREFSKGPVSTLGALARFEPTPEGGCICHYEIRVTAANLLGWLILNTGFFKSAKATFHSLCEQAEDWARSISPLPFELTPHQLDAPARRRVDDMLLALERSPYGHGLGDRLVDWVLRASEVDLVRMRPIALARQFGVTVRPMVEACLQAVRVGLLQQRWDLLCPRCRGAKLTVDGLDQLPDSAHCDACNIDYDRDFARNVEITFTPSAALRPVYDGEFCLGGPMTTPHVCAQLKVDGDGSRSEAGTLPLGSYRMRTLDVGPYAEVEHQGGPFPALLITDNEILADGNPDAASLVVRNRTHRSRIAVIERRDWAEDALTAERVTTYQAFRDICAAERLRPGDGAGVSQVALMFTDLKGSSDLYRRVGDALAYGQVRGHFAYLADQVRRHDGAIVKTMGDAVLAAFAEPADALRAAIDIQRGIDGFNRRNQADLAMKIGVHAGSCLAVTLNDRLDYFGQTVNLAARLQGEARGGEVVISGRLHDDPTVRPLLEPFDAQEERATLRGFALPERLWRIRPDQQSDPDTGR